MMLDIDGILTHHDATPTDVLTAAQALAVSAVGDLTNKTFNGQCSMVNGQCSTVNGQSSAALHRFADAIAEQIREALHKRIDEGVRSDW